MILLSEHSYERCKERVNIHGSKALIRAEKAYYLGKDIEAFDKVNAERIFVFPSNGNVILTAEQAAKLYTESEIIVINTKTIGEGYAAISMMETDGKTEDIIDGINESVK